jgi:FdhD protein
VKEDASRLTVEVAVSRIGRAGRSGGHSALARELPLSIELNGRELLTTLCSPQDLDCLVAGLLFSEGLISRKDDIESLQIDEKRGLARVTTRRKTASEQPALKPLVASGGGKGASGGAPAIAPVTSSITIGAARALELMNNFLGSSPAHEISHGVHSAALCDTRSMLIFKEDIGRHNALDKVFGEALLKGMPTQDAIVLISGRVSSEMLLKVARRDVPVLIARASPTDLGAALAEKLNMTLARAAPHSLWLYSGARRITAD